MPLDGSCCLTFGGLADDGAGDGNDLLRLGWQDVPELLRQSLPLLTDLVVVLLHNGFRIAAFKRSGRDAIMPSNRVGEPRMTADVLR